ncbi:hypothetical protein BD311DRAFT_761120 [Dichomitus squalens]|uniref:Uncharacterized protein n=1 Tax=Dichomitus squalens TaxID=114155 RepID=A0A4Q9MLF2_9APHY|nr:hypothetical protein BD311DRAFT_761120 [Dichomitus squalens]
MICKWKGCLAKIAGLSWFKGVIGSGGGGGVPLHPPPAATQRRLPSHASPPGPHSCPPSYLSSILPSSPLLSRPTSAGPPCASTLQRRYLRHRDVIDSSGPETMALDHLYLSALCQAATRGGTFVDATRASLTGAEVLDGTPFVRVSAPTLYRVGCTREGQEDTS